jgi:hypothetical protein
LESIISLLKVVSEVNMLKTVFCEKKDCIYMPSPAFFRPKSEVSDKNSLLGGLNTGKAELYVKKKRPQDIGAFLSRLRDSLTKSFNLIWESINDCGST